MATVYCFADCVPDTGSYELRRGGVPVPVEPLVLDLIRALLERPGQVVSRDELMDSVRQGRIVSESTISTAVKWARQDAGPAAAAARECLRTKPDLSRDEVVCVLGERLGEGVWALVRAPGER